MTHEKIWRAIELIAKQNNFTCSRLAQVSGLDSTTFNKSKRFDAFRKKRYPSMQSLIKVLRATGLTMTQFGKICDGIDTKSHKKSED